MMIKEASQRITISKALKIIDKNFSIKEIDIIPIY